MKTCNINNLERQRLFLILKGPLFSSTENTENHLIFSLGGLNPKVGVF